MLFKIRNLTLILIMNFGLAAINAMTIHTNASIVINYNVVNLFKILISDCVEKESIINKFNDSKRDLDAAKQIYDKIFNGNNNIKVKCIGPECNGLLNDIQILIESAGEPYIYRTITYSTLVETALKNGQQKILELLASKLTDPNIQDQEGNTALIIAIYMSRAFSFDAYENVLRLLLDLGADVNVQSNSNILYPGLTPLMIAIKYETLELIELLLKYGANPFIQNLEGQTAFNFNDTDSIDVTPNMRRRKTETLLRQAIEKQKKEFVSFVSIMAKTKYNQKLQHLSLQK